MAEAQIKEGNADSVESSCYLYILPRARLLEANSHDADVPKAPFAFLKKLQLATDGQLNSRIPCLPEVPSMLLQMPRVSQCQE
jgi:hypothetical protein